MRRCCAPALVPISHCVVTTKEVPRGAGPPGTGASAGELPCRRSIGRWCGQTIRAQIPCGRWAMCGWRPTATVGLDRRATGGPKGAGDGRRYQATTACRPRAADARCRRAVFGYHETSMTRSLPSSADLQADAVPVITLQGRPVRRLLNRDEPVHRRVTSINFDQSPKDPAAQHHRVVLRYIDANRVS